MQTVAQICQGASPLNIVDVRSLEVGFQHPIGKFDGALPEFEKINAAAYWNYQRTKVYVRTSKTIRKSGEAGVHYHRRGAASTGMSRSRMLLPSAERCPVRTSSGPITATARVHCL